MALLLLLVSLLTAVSWCHCQHEDHCWCWHWLQSSDVTVLLQVSSWQHHCLYWSYDIVACIIVGIGISYIASLLAPASLPASASWCHCWCWFHGISTTMYITVLLLVSALEFHCHHWCQSITAGISKMTALPGSVSEASPQHHQTVSTMEYWWWHLQLQ